MASPLAGQTVGTLDIGTSVVEYDGFLVSGAAALSPTVQYHAADFSLGAQGTWVIFESGSEIFQGTAAAAWLSPARNGWRVELAGSLGLSKYEDSAAFGHTLARTRLHFHGDNTGAWLSGDTGTSFGESAETPLEVALGAWAVGEDVAVVGTITRSWLGGGGYVDVAGAARWSAGKVALDARAGVRPWTDGVETDAFAEFSALVALGERITAMVSGGRYLSDPVRGVLAADYVSVGLRLNLFSAPAPRLPIVARAMARAAGELAASDHGSQARLEVARVAGGTGTLRVHVAGVESVELRGDFTDWQPVSLERIGPATWEIQLAIASGVHRLNIRVETGPWLVPRGTRLEQNEFGAAVGIVLIP